MLHLEMLLSVECRAPAVSIKKSLIDRPHNGTARSPLVRLEREMLFSTTMYCWCTRT